MASNFSFQSSSSSSHHVAMTYEVFVSFRGEDIHSNLFTDFLFQALHKEGIVAFKDNTHLKIGQSIAPDVLQAIERSRLFIVVFSKNYASSTWCLRELAHICNCIETSPRPVLPIFYDVSPLEVRKQNGCYEKAFRKHEERFKDNQKMMEEMQRWREVLAQVANLSGWDINNKSQYTGIEKFVQHIIEILGHKIPTLPKKEEGTSAKKDVGSFKKLSGLVRIRDFISLLLTYPMKLDEEGIFQCWISAFPKWKAQLLSTDCHTVIDASWHALTEKALKRMEGFMPWEIMHKIERGERLIFNHNDAIPEAILHLSVDLAVNQLIQTLFSRDYSVHYVRLLARDLVEKRIVVNKIVVALEEKHNMFGVDKDFLRALWINSSIYETDAEVRVQEEIHTMMAGSSATQDHDIEEKIGINRHLVIVVDADSNKKLDLQKVHFPTGIVVLITTEPSTQAEKDDEFRISCTMDLNIRTPDHLLPWEVFCSYVGSHTISSSMAIQRCAEKIVKECQGHLLAVGLVANYLKNVTDGKQWELALDKLRSLNSFYDYQHSDQMGISRVMVNAFVNIIWKVMDDTRKLFLELILFVENIKIRVSNSILVSNYANIFPTGLPHPLDIIRHLLQRFVLLQYESGGIYLPVETYDIIKSLHSSNPSIIRHGALGLMEPPYVGRWHVLIRMELMDNKIYELPQSPDCPKLKVLLLQGNVDLMDIPDSFFNHMPLLQHLDLSYTSIRDLPPSVSKLIQLEKFYLRGCDLFIELPLQIAQLKNLQEFDLDGTLITHLPEEIRQLINLKSLTLCFDRCHHFHGKKGEQFSNSTIIPPGVISNLTQLNYLSINVDPEDERWDENGKSVLLEIFGLERLEKVSIYVPKAELLELMPPAKKSINWRLVVGHHMRRFISRVTPEVEQEFKRCGYSLKFVNGENVPNGVKMNLGHFTALYLDRHMTINSLSDFELKNLRCLQVCILAECNAMETIVDGSHSHNELALAGLKSLVVLYMKNLRSICEVPCPFFLLKSLALHTCLMLTTIFTLDSLHNLRFLEEIIVEDCPKVSTLVSHVSPQQKPVVFLPELKSISLLYLPELVNICNGLHVGPILEKMVFYYCPKLRSLSKSELSSTSLKVIKGERMWWEALKWNAAEWGDAGRPKHFEQIFSPFNEKADIMKQLATHQKTQISTRHNDFPRREKKRSVPISSIYYEERSVPILKKERKGSVRAGNECRIFAKPDVVPSYSEKARVQREVNDITQMLEETSTFSEEVEMEEMIAD